MRGVGRAGGAAERRRAWCRTHRPPPGMRAGAAAVEVLPEVPTAAANVTAMLLLQQRRQKRRCWSWRDPRLWERRRRQRRRQTAELSAAVAPAAATVGAWGATEMRAARRPEGAPAVVLLTARPLGGAGTTAAVRRVVSEMSPWRKAFRSVAAAVAAAPGNRRAREEDAEAGGESSEGEVT